MILLEYHLKDSLGRLENYLFRSPHFPQEAILPNHVNIIYSSNIDVEIYWGDTTAPRAPRGLFLELTSK